jgi:hypothetical protein
MEAWGGVCAACAPCLGQGGVSKLLLRQALSAVSTITKNEFISSVQKHIGISFAFYMSTWMRYYLPFCLFQSISMPIVSDLWDVEFGW